MPFQSGITLIFVSYSKIWLSFIFTDDSFEGFTPKWCEWRNQCFAFFPAMIISIINCFLVFYKIWTELFQVDKKHRSMIIQNLLLIKFLCSIFVFVFLYYQSETLIVNELSLCTMWLFYKYANTFLKYINQKSVHSLRICFQVT